MEAMSLFLAPTCDIGFHTPSVEALRQTKHPPGTPALRQDNDVISEYLSLVGYATKI
jgi:hypothetical protein